jgi:hypothetical protein
MNYLVAKLARYPFGQVLLWAIHPHSELKEYSYFKNKGL